jgi:catechol 2,3-dioxygenase-like lactoylglutathione lyase family enzyme
MDDPPHPDSPPRRAEGVERARLRRLGHVGLWARDPVGLAAWYRDLLGFRITDTMDYDHWGARGTAVFLRVAQDHHDLVVFPRPAHVDDATFAAFNRLSHIAYEVSTLEELFRLKALFQERGVTIVRGVGRLYPGGNYNLDILDPEGNRVELFADIEQIGWDGRARPREQWRPYRVFEDVEAARADG